LEVQQPTDFTIRTERTTPSGLKLLDVSCHQGIGFDLMFECFHYAGLDEAETLERYRIKPEKTESGLALIDSRTTNLFSLEKLYVNRPLKVTSGGRFQVMLIWDGSGFLKWDGGAAPVSKGNQVFIPAATEEYTLEGRMTALVCRGPSF
jgi:mannose-6-phosphate isomerase